MRNQVGSGSALMQGIARKITKNRIFQTENPESVSSFSDGIAGGTCRARASPTFAWEKSRQPEAQVSEKRYDSGQTPSSHMTAVQTHDRQHRCTDGRGRERRT